MVRRNVFFFLIWNTKLCKNFWFNAGFCWLWEQIGIFDLRRVLEQTNTVFCLSHHHTLCSLCSFTPDCMIAFFLKLLKITNLSLIWQKGWKNLWGLRSLVWGFSVVLCFWSFSVLHCPFYLSHQFQVYQDSHLSSSGFQIIYLILHGFGHI